MPLPKNALPANWTVVPSALVAEAIVYALDKARLTQAVDPAYADGIQEQFDNICEELAKLGLLSNEDFNRLVRRQP